MNYDIRDIQNTIPHRYPMLLIDKIIDLQDGAFIIA
jgi:3-hydroxymyristoyl/3-hydroxydecanoyl-(acyl carrier protein) dehydratase